MLDKDEIMEKLETEHILTFMAEMGEYPYKRVESKNEIWFATLCHGGDSHKLCYFEDSKTFYCYTNCGFLSVFDFLKSAMNIDFYSALLLVAEKVGVNQRIGLATTNNSSKMAQELKEINKYILMRKKKKKEKIILPKVSDDILEYFEDDIFFDGWIKEGISIETMHKYGIRWHELEKAIIIPHTDCDGRLVGIRRRSLLAKNSKNKYMPLSFNNMTYSHSLNLNLYGIEKNKETIKKMRKVFLTEGEKSVLLANDYYSSGNFTVATCGFNISKWHRDMILSLGVEEVIIGFDKDFDPQIETDESHPDYLKFKQYLNRILKLANIFTPYCRTYVIWDTCGKLEIKDSPFDQGKEVLEYLMENKVEITTQLLEGDY